MTEWVQLLRQKRAKGGFLSVEEARRLQYAKPDEFGRKLQGIRLERQRSAFRTLWAAIVETFIPQTKDAA